jgi:hypothetical protein
MGLVAERLEHIPKQRSAAGFGSSRAGNTGIVDENIESTETVLNARKRAGSIKSPPILGGLHHHYIRV